MADDDRKPMPVPGDATAAREEGARGAGGASGAGQSGGGAYPNPHQPGEGKPDDGFMGHGGQSEVNYHGPGQLGDEDVGGADNPNAATRAE